jgi:hypothetical protein
MLWKWFLREWNEDKRSKLEVSALLVFAVLTAASLLITWSMGNGADPHMSPRQAQDSAESTTWY